MLCRYQLDHLLRRRLSPDNGFIAIKVLGNLLQRRVPGLDVKLPNNKQFKHQPDTVHNAVLPANVLDGNWVDVLIEEETERHAEEHQRQAFGTEVVGENLGGVAHEQPAESDVVEDVVEEYEDNDCVSSIVVFAAGALGVASESNGHGGEGEKHANTRGKKEAAPSKLVHKEADTGGGDDVYSIEDGVDSQDRVGVCYSDEFEELFLSAICYCKERDITHLGQEVRDNAVSRPLREEPDRNQDDGAVSVARSRPQLRPPIALQLLFERDGLLDLVELYIDQFVVLVALGVDICQDLLRLVQFAL